MRTLTAIVTFLVFCGWAAGGRAAEVEDPAPEFTLVDDQGQLWNSREHVGKWPLVIYFYPSDFAFCCTRQAVGYRDGQDDLAKQCVEVVGISCDVVEAHRLFKDSLGLKFALLSDEAGQVARLFDVPLREGGKAMAVSVTSQSVAIPRKFTAARWTFIIGTNGRILHRETEVLPMKDSQRVVEFFRKMNSK